MPILPTARPVGTPTLASLSPAQAAHHVKVSRRTIMRAIEAQELPAFRDNRNRWQIVLQELDSWAGAQWARREQCTLDAHSSAHPTQEETARDLAAARATIAQLEARLEERTALVQATAVRAQAAESRAEAAETLAAKLTDLLAARAALTPDPPPPRRRGWFWRRA